MQAVARADLRAKRSVGAGRVLFTPPEIPRRRKGPLNAGEARRLGVSPGSLRQNELVQCQIRHRFTEPTILEAQAPSSASPARSAARRIPAAADNKSLRSRHTCSALRDQDIRSTAGFATISSGFRRFLAIVVLLDVQHIPQVGSLPGVDQCGIRKDRQDIINSDIRAQE